MLKKKIPMKNYIILMLLFIITFLLTFYLYRWYVVYSTYQDNIPVIKDSLTELTEEEMEHYIDENPISTVYICTANDSSCRNFEKNFKKIIEKNSLKEYIIYVRLTDDNKDEFINRFNSNHPYKKSALTKYPAIILFEDGEVSDILQETDNEKLSISDVKSFIKRNKIGNNY